MGKIIIQADNQQKSTRHLARKPDIQYNETCGRKVDV